MQITLVHASWHPLSATNEAFARLWSEARLRHLLDDGLSADLVSDGGIRPSMTKRFADLTSYAVTTGADAVLFTCSAFGPCIEAAAAAFPSVPVLKPNEAMIEEAAAFGGAVGLLASFGPTLASMLPEFPPNLEVRPKLVEGALAAFSRGDGAEHDRLVAQASRALTGCNVIALAQFSLVRAAGAVHREVGLPVLAAPDCAIRRLRRMLH